MNPVACGNIRFSSLFAAGDVPGLVGLVEMNFGLVLAGYSLPEWQAVKLTFDP